MLSGTALAIAVVALVISLVIPGPAGPVGPAGKGTVVSTTQRSPVQRVFSTSCHHMLGDEVAIAVTGPGTVVVVAHAVGVNIGHVNTSWDVAILNLATTTTTCASVTEPRGQVEAPTPLPSMLYYTDLTFSNTFVVSAAGTYTYYLNEYMYGGGNDDDFLDSGVLVAVFYPS